MLGYWHNLVVSPLVVISGNEEEKFRKLMAGDFSDYGGDLSCADMALVNALGRRFHNDVFRINDAWLGSPCTGKSWSALTTVP